MSIVVSVLLLSISHLALPVKCTSSEIFAKCSLEIIMLSEYGFQMFPSIFQEIQKYQVYSASLNTTKTTLQKHLFVLRNKFLHKHSTCSTLIIDGFTFITKKSKTNKRFDISETFIVNKYNPNYVLILTNVQNWKKIERIFLLVLKTSMLSSIIFIWIVQTGKNYMEIYCIPCAHKKNSSKFSSNIT